MSRTPNFHAVLTADTAVAGLVQTRVYPGKLPDKPTLPAVVVQQINTRRGRGYCGTDGIALRTLQLDIYAKSATERQQVAAAVLDSLVDFRGMAGDTLVKDCAITSDFDSVDPEPGYLRRTQLWDVWFVER